MTLREGQLARQRQSFLRKLPDLCTIYSTANTVRSLYLPASTQYPDGVPCRVTELPLRTDFDDAGNPIYTRYFNLTLPGNLLVPPSAVQAVVFTRDNLTLQSLAAIPGEVSEQIGIVVQVQQVAKQ